MNTQLNQWISNLYRHGAIGVDERDAFKERLNVVCEDFNTITADLDKYIKYMPERWQQKWAARELGGK